MLASKAAALVPRQTPHCHSNTDPCDLAEIYQQQYNLAIWERRLETELETAVAALLSANPRFKLALNIAAPDAFAALQQVHQLGAQTALCQDIAELVDMFCTLFDTERAGLRLAALDAAMCPRFHVDHIPCRMITTYQGVATEWLPNHLADRSKLGRGANGLQDHESGLYQQASDIQQLACGSVALLKGERWEGNEGSGIIHRSPSLADAQQRLLLTLDFAN